MKKMVVLLINEKNSDSIRKSVVETFSDRDVSFCEPLTKGKLTFEEMIDYDYVQNYVDKHEFTHILVSGVTVLNIFVSLAARIKFGKIGLLVHNRDTNRHEELFI